MRLRSDLLGGTAIAGMLLFSTASLAQSAVSTPVPTTPTDNATSAAPDATGQSEILVTGSRIAQTNLASPSPISTITAAELQTAGGPTLEQALNRLPQVVGAFTASSQVNPRGGVSSLDLRGLGQNRTLLLLDGQRLTPADPDGSADINVLPTGLIERVDIVTGGASATYGSDAVAGVVNFVLDKHFEGLKADMQYGVTDRGDAGNQRFELTGGKTFADGRAHFEGTFSYAKRDYLGADSRAATSNSRLDGSLVNGPVTPSASNLPSQSAINAIFSGYGVAAGTVSRSAGLAVNDDGSLYVPVGAINYRPGAATAGIPQADINGTVYRVRGDYEPISSPLTVYQGFGRFDYEVTPSIDAYVQGNYAHYTNQTNTRPANATFSVPVTNPYIPAALATILASRPDPTAAFNVTRSMADIGAQYGNNRNDTFEVTTGLSGKDFFKDWAWDASYTYGAVTQHRTYHNGFSTTQAETLLNAADGGASLCGGGFDAFVYTPLSTACVNYLTPVKTVTDRQRTTQQVAEANLRGSLFKLPAGNLHFAVGADWRSDTASFDADPNDSTANYTGYLAADGATSFSGSQTTKEAYAELLVPILADLPFVRSLTANLGYRYSDYNSIGGVSTYKAMLEWRPAEPLLLRGGYQRAIRAPSIGELYSPAGVGGTQDIGSPTTAGLGDPCDVRSSYRTGANAAQVRNLCLAQGVPTAVIDSYSYGSTAVTSNTGGNTSLKQEQATTYSFGAVLSPKLTTGLVTGLSLSADYFSIDIKNAIDSISPSVALQNCFNANGANASFSNASPFCQLVSRDPSTGQISQIPQTYQNLGRIKTTGVDVEFTGTLHLDETGLGSNAGSLELAMSGTRLTSYKISNFPGDPLTDYVGTIGGGQDSFHPKWRSSTTLTYANGPASVSLQWRYIAKMRDASTVGTTGSNAIGVPAYNYFDLTARIVATKSFEFRIGMLNIADKQPPVYTSYVFFNTDPLNYDVYGRRFYVGATAHF